MSNKITILLKLVRRKTELEEQVSSLEKENCKLRTEQEANLLAVTERDQKVCAVKPGKYIALWHWFLLYTYDFCFLYSFIYLFLSFF